MLYIAIGLAGHADCDPYWTLVGYFNSIKELATQRALYAQDIPERLQDGLGSTRELSADPEELSGRTKSLDLPRILDLLMDPLPAPPAAEATVDALITTSMFGTGIDVPRLGLMVVHGQPKTTSAYIQATGRVGRTNAGVVVALLKPTRPRDFNHYEFFVGYHRALHRWVEPITVAPFAARTRDRTLGPAQVALLRQASVVGGERTPLSWQEAWAYEQRVAGPNGAVVDSSARNMALDRGGPLMAAVNAVFEGRAQDQPGNLRPAPGRVARDAAAKLDLWQVRAQQADPDGLVYWESTAVRAPQLDVVLGDEAHQTDDDRAVVFENAPNSLRDVEPTLGVEVR